MNTSRLYVLLLLCFPVLAQSWKFDNEERKPREGHKDTHYLTKRHMRSKETESTKKRSTTPRQRVKPPGQLAPLQEEEIDNDDTVSIAIDPPPNKLKPKKTYRKKVQKSVDVTPMPPTAETIEVPVPKRNDTVLYSATELVKNVLTELGKEFITHQANEDFVFGQYVGNAMRNLTHEFRIKMQHEILELVVKYQKLSRGDTVEEKDPRNLDVVLKKIDTKFEKKPGNETEEGWTDFSNLANIVV